MSAASGERGASDVPRIREVVAGVARHAIDRRSAGYVSLLRLAFALLLRRMLPRVVLLVSVLSAVAASVFTDARPGEGHRVLANAAGLLAVSVAVFSAVLGAVTIAGDSTTGALRAVLIRPVSRTALVLAHATSQIVTTVLLYLAGLAVAIPICAATTGFGDVRLEDFVITDVATMNAHALRLLLMPLPALCCAPLVAIIVSVLVEDVATAVVLALAIVGGPLLFGKFVGEVPGFLFARQVLDPLNVLAELAQGNNTRELEVRTTGYLAACLLQPLAWGAASFTAAALVFRAREVRV